MTKKRKIDSSGDGRVKASQRSGSSRLAKLYVAVRQERDTKDLAYPGDTSFLGTFWSRSKAKAVARAIQHECEDSEVKRTWEEDGDDDLCFGFHLETTDNRTIHAWVEETDIIKLPNLKKSRVYVVQNYVSKGKKGEDLLESIHKDLESAIDSMKRLGRNLADQESGEGTLSFSMVPGSIKGELFVARYSEPDDADDGGSDEDPEPITTNLAGVRVRYPKRAEVIEDENVSSADEVA